MSGNVPQTGVVRFDPRRQRDLPALTKAVHDEFVRLTVDREQSVVRREVKLGEDLGGVIATDQAFWPGFGQFDSEEMWLRFLELSDSEIAAKGGKALADRARVDEIGRFGLLPLPLRGAEGFNAVSERAAIRGVSRYLIQHDLNAIRFDFIGGRATA
jgi:hypothetical protein